MRYERLLLLGFFSFFLVLGQSLACDVSQMRKVAQEKAIALGNAPYQTKKIPIGSTKVKYLNGGETISIQTVDVDDNGKEEAQYIFTKQSDGKYSVEKTLLKPGGKIYVSSYLADAAPITSDLVKQVNRDRIAKEANEKRMSEVRAELVKEYNENFDIGQDLFLKSKTFVEKINSIKGKNWDETDIVARALTVSLLELPRDKLVGHLSAGIKLLKLSREKVLNHIEGKEIYDNTIFDPLQKRYVEIIQAINATKDYGIDEKIKTLRSELIQKLDQMNAF